MAEDMAEKVKALLGDPEMAAKIAMIAQSFSGSNTSSSQTAVPAAPADVNTEGAAINAPPSAPPVAPARAGTGENGEEVVKYGGFAPLSEAKRDDAGNTQPAAQEKATDKRIDLIKSVKPFLKKEKQDKLDGLLKTVSILSIVGDFRGKS